MTHPNITDDQFKKRLEEIIPTDTPMLLARLRPIYKKKFDEDTPYVKKKLLNFISSCTEFIVSLEDGTVRFAGETTSAQRTSATPKVTKKVTPTQKHTKMDSVKDSKKGVTGAAEMKSVIDLSNNLSALRLEEHTTEPGSPSLAEHLLTRKFLSREDFSDRDNILIDGCDPPDSGGLLGSREFGSELTGKTSWEILGSAEEADLNHNIIAKEDQVYLQTGAPFCAVCIGVQGAGKSHTMNVMLENCLLPALKERDFEVISGKEPMCGLVMHFDQSQSNACEAVGLCKSAFKSFAGAVIKLPNMVVLVSPSFYLQRKSFYKQLGVTVLPLLFDWGSLTAAQLRKLMRLSDTDAQLYVSTMLSMLRDYQRKEHLPTFEQFLTNVVNTCDVKGQSKPLEQRLELLKTFIRDSEKNVEIAKLGKDWSNLLKPGTVVVADLTDPMLSADEACGVFQVLLEQFRSAPMSGVGKVVAFDEAHRYLSHAGPGCTELSQAVVDTVRMMRHEGMRILLSTQSPTTLPPELLELASMTVLHRFQSAEWIKYLASKVPLPEDSFERIKRLQRGQALVLSTKISSTLADPLYPDCATMTIRPRLTWDLGASRMHDVPRQSAEKA